MDRYPSEGSAIGAPALFADDPLPINCPALCPALDASSILLGALSLRRRPCLLSSVECEALVDRLELLWSRTGLQCSADDLIDSGLIQVVLPLETTDRSLQELICFPPLIPVSQLVNDLLLLGEATLDRV